MAKRVVILGNSYAAYCQIPALRWANAHGAPNDIVAICGKNLAKAHDTATRFGIPIATTSLDEALGARPDLIIVSTPVDLHAAMVERAITTTKAAILCEKPFTLRTDDARALSRLARQEGRLALVDHQLRMSPPRRRLRELVRAGAVGSPWVARTEMCFGSVERLTRRASWWDEASRGGGVMQAVGSHLVDGLLWIFGPIVDVQARLTTCLRERAGVDGGAPVPVTADDHCELWLTHASGVRATVVCTTVQTHGRRSLLEVIGSEGVVRLVDEDELTIARHGEAAVRVDVTLPSVADVDACNDSAFARCEPLFLRALVRALDGDAGALEGEATFDDAVSCVEVLNAASMKR